MRNKRANGGNARAKKLSPDQRSAIAKKGAAARWSDVLPKALKSHSKHTIGEQRPFMVATLRDQIASAVITGLYANIADSQKFANFVMPGVLLPEAFTRMAYTQADEVLRLRAL